VVLCVIGVVFGQQLPFMDSIDDVEGMRLAVIDQLFTALSTGNCSLFVSLFTPTGEIWEGTTMITQGHSAMHKLCLLEFNFTQQKVVNYSKVVFSGSGAVLQYRSLSISRVDSKYLFGHTNGIEYFRFSNSTGLIERAVAFFDINQPNATQIQKQFLSAWSYLNPIRNGGVVNCTQFSRHFTSHATFVYPYGSPIIEGRTAIDEWCSDPFFGPLAYSSLIWNIGDILVTGNGAAVGLEFLGYVVREDGVGSTIMPTVWILYEVNDDTGLIDHLVSFQQPITVE